MAKKKATAKKATAKKVEYTYKGIELVGSVTDEDVKALAGVSEDAAVAVRKLVDEVLWLKRVK